MLADQLTKIVGPRWVKTRDAELVAYDSDGLPGYHAKPRLAVFPGSRDELIAIVQLLAREKVAFVPRGAGTGLSGGALSKDTVLIGLNRLTQIIDVDATNRIARVEPGVVNALNFQFAIFLTLTNSMCAKTVLKISVLQTVRSLLRREEFRRVFVVSVWSEPTWKGCSTAGFVFLFLSPIFLSLLCGNAKTMKDRNIEDRKMSAMRLLSL